MPPKRKLPNDFQPFSNRGTRWRDIASQAAAVAAAGLFGRSGGPASRGGSRSGQIQSILASTRTASSSRTATQNRIRTGTVMNEGTGGQCSYFNGPKGKSFLPKSVEDYLPLQVIQTNAAYQLKSAVGLQNAGTVLSLCQPAIVTSYTGSDKISHALLHSATGEVTFNNCLLSNVYVIIYDIMCRKDVSSSSLAGPDSAWIQGDTDEGTATAYQKLGSTPWQSDVFNQYYKVLQQTKVVLAAGGTHVHHVRLKPKKLVAGSYAYYTGYGLKDTTYHCLLEFHGSPANDKTLQTQVTVGAGALNIVVDYEQHLKQLAKPTPTLSSSNNLLTSFSNGEQVLNLGGSTIVDNAMG